MLHGQGLTATVLALKFYLERTLCFRRSLPSPLWRAAELENRRNLLELILLIYI